MQQPAFGNLFSSGARAKASYTPHHSATLSVHEAGWLQLPTWRLVAMDPGWWIKDPTDVRYAFEETVDPGNYRVTASIARFGGSGVERLAAVKLTIQPEPPVRWSVARCTFGVPEGEDPAKYGFSVDSGQRCYMDFAMLSVLRRYDSSPERDEAMWAAQDSPSQCAEFIDPDGTLNAIFFTCGMGDGAYTTWVGWNRLDQIVCFATDSSCSCNQRSSSSGADISRAPIGACRTACRTACHPVGRWDPPRRWPGGFLIREPSSDAIRKQSVRNLF